MNRGLLFGLLVLLCVLVCVHSDIYMHVPRGSNNRLIDANEYTNNDQRERDNDKRLFNSQNNDRGGYPAPAHTLNGTGEMYYYERSILSVEWTAQHSCLNPTTSCDFIIQYMCDNNGLVRDGAVKVAYTVDPTNGVLIPTPRADTLANGANNAGFDFTMLHEFQVNSGTIPVTSEEVKGNTAKCVEHNCDSDPKYGRHESLDYWLRCTNTKRNFGLFTADQNLNNQGNNNNNAKVNSAGRTRQNANGDRHGYECAEERDYYPYWNPSPWKDIAILTNDVSRCAAWQDQSQNVRGRYICVYQPSQALTDHLWNINTAAGTGTNNFGWIPTTQADCEAPVNPAYAALGRGVWTLVPAFGIAPPKCIQHSAPTRDNSLGNAVGGYPYNFNWTIPSDYGENCVLRIRYNITSAELSVDPNNNYQLTGTDELHGRFAGYNSATDVQSLIDSKHNSQPAAGQNANTYPTNLQIWRLYGLSDGEHPTAQYPPNNNVQGTIRADGTGQYYSFTRGYYFEGNPHVDIFGDLLMNGNGLTDGFSSAGCAANTNPNGVSDTNYPVPGPCWQLRRSITNNVYPADGTTGRNANDWDNNGNSRNTAFVTLRLSFNTNQFSRTFQDRSYTFSIRPRPPALQKYNIYNLNVKGKRGNIVQTYPSTEYDFHPNHLMLNKGDLVHIQWGGSDYTNRNNAGQGTGGIDRSNIVMLRSSRDMDPVFNKYGQATGADSNGLTTYGSWGTNYPGWIDDQTKYPFLGLDFIDLNRLAFNGLNYSYFDLGPRQVTKAGIYHYMSSRNNQFTNRSQKGKIVVLNTVAPNTPMDGSGQPAALQWSALMAYQGGSNSAGAYLSVGDLNGYEDISQVPEALTTQDPWIQSLPTSGYDTQWIVLNPPMIEITQKCTEKYGGLWLVIPIPLKPLHNAVVYYKSNATSSDLTSIDGVTSSSTSVSVPIGGNAGQQGGYYTVKLEPNQGAIAGIVIGAVAFICIASFIVWKVKIQPAGGFQAWLRAQKIGKGTKTAAGESDSVALVNGQTNNAV